jgi:hypothetical protein
MLYFLSSCNFFDAWMSPLCFPFCTFLDINNLCICVVKSILLAVAYVHIQMHFRVCARIAFSVCVAVQVRFPH